MQKTGFSNALGTVVYIVLVSTFMQNGERIFGKEDTIIIPIAILLLFVLSAIIVGYLVLGKPVMLYLDGKKKEAVSLLMMTAGWLAGFMVLALIIAYFIK